MRLPVHIIFIIAFGSVDATSAVRCTRAIKFCNITDVITGVATSQEYNDCSQICCGKFYKKNVFFTFVRH